jgi:hypothetical protein
VVTRNADISQYKQGGFMKKVCFVFQWVIILLVGFAFIAAAAEKTSDRRYNLPDHGVFQMKVPASWKDEVKQPPNDLPPTIALRPASGDQFLILILPIWKTKEDAPLLSEGDMQKMVQRAADNAQPNAVEKTLKIIELQGSSGRGYYFSATDKAPEPGSYKFLTQGILKVGELAVTFTILTNNDKKDVESAALTMIKSAIQVKEKGK